MAGMIQPSALARRAGMSDHLAAALLASPTLSRAGGHPVVVLSQGFAFFGASRAGLGTGLARHSAENAMTCNDLCRGRAKVGAIEARLQRHQKRLLAFAHHVGAMRRAEITLTLAVGTGPCTRFEMISRIPIADCRSSVVCVAGEWQGREDGTPQSRHGELASVDHGHSLFYVCWRIELRPLDATAMPTRGRVAGSYKLANR
jgi:hypothetical protein